MVAADTCVLIRLLTRDDEAQYARAAALGPVWVSHVVLLESLWVLGSCYGFDRARLELTLEILLEHQQVALESPTVVLALREKMRAHPDVGPADLLILQIALARNLTLATFDRSLARVVGVQRP